MNTTIILSSHSKTASLPKKREVISMCIPHKLSLCAVCILLASCSNQAIKPSDQHMSRETETAVANKDIPQPLTNSVVLPPPKPAIKTQTYSVVVTNVPAQQILFELARDAKINLDVQGGIDGLVTMNAINQTLPQILTRIAKQVDMRYELNNGYLAVMPDTPYLHSYKIDYVNMTRDSDGSISNSSLVGSAASGGGASGGASGGAGGGNNSTLAIKNSSKNHFWEHLEKNITDILRETDKILPDGSSETTVQQNRTGNSTGTGAAVANAKRSAGKIGLESSPNPVSIEEGDITVTRRSTFREAASVISNPETGLITVRATGRQHEKIQNFIDQVMASARRQVLIEATIVEVSLSDRYQQGIDWSRLRLGTKGFQISQGPVPSNQVPAIGTLILDYANPTSKFGNIAASISLLETFGNVKVLSSPKLSVMNNQTAMLRVVDNNVYFIVNSTTTPNSIPGGAPIISYTTTVNTVPIGFTMSVTPQINDSDTVLLNVRPSITRRLLDVQDPTPNLAVPNFIPQTSTREMDSMLKIENNQIAVLGGLMEDRVGKTTQEVPLLARLPFVGSLFQNHDKTSTKTELVIFLRPIVIKNASVDGDYSGFRGNLPDQDFFKETAIGNP